MSTYKVIQDIEAEDHILGPLTLRQFIFAIIAMVGLYICFVCLTRHLQFLLVVFLPPSVFFGFFAFPFGKDQPTEIWALAKIRYYFKPRKRVWDQSGVKELVTVTVPKKIQHNYTNGLNQNEVQSRLSALANTIDSRGWAIKNVTVNAYSQPNPLMAADSDRLINVNNLPQEVSDDDIRASDDILDPTNNAVAQQFDQMINANSQNHRQALIDQMNGVRQNVGGMPPATPADYWFMNQPAQAPQLTADQSMFKSSVILPGVPDSAASASLNLPMAAVPAVQPISTADEATLAAQLRSSSNSQHVSNSHLRTLQTSDDRQQQQAAQLQAEAEAQAAAFRASQLAAATQAKPVPAQPDAAILSLARNNDLDVATLARQAKKAEQNDAETVSKSSKGDEVVISLR